MMRIDDPDWSDTVGSCERQQHAARFSQTCTGVDCRQSGLLGKRDDRGDVGSIGPVAWDVFFARQIGFCLSAQNCPKYTKTTL